MKIKTFLKNQNKNQKCDADIKILWYNTHEANMTKEELIIEFDKLQNIYGSKNCNSVYGGGCDNNPDICLVFINPTARNIATSKTWTGIRCQWLGTKQVWKFLTECGLFDENLNKEIQSKKPKDWTPEFCEKVYAEVKNKRIYITNLAKCTQDDARGLPDSVFDAYRDLLLKELELVNPKKIILFGNQVSSIVLKKKISVSACRRQSYNLETTNKEFSCYPVFYPVGNGFFNAPKAIEDVKYIISQTNNNMQTLIMCSSGVPYSIVNGEKVPARFSNDNKYLSNLKRLFTKRDCFVEISGKSTIDAEKTKQGKDHLAILKKTHELSGITFKEYIYVDDSNKDHIKDYIQKADVISLRGGHGPTCNKFVNELNLKDLLKDFKGIVMGGSGGAMNLADKVYFPPEEPGEVLDPHYTKDYKGCALTTINIFPHFDEVRHHIRDGLEVEHDILLPDSYKYELIALNNGSYIIQQGNRIEIFGEAYLIKNGEIEQICKNDESKIIKE